MTNSRVEGHAPAIRSAVLREKLTLGFARSRQSSRQKGADMIRRAYAELSTRTTHDQPA